MKKNFAFLLLFTLTAFTSCSDDDKKPSGPSVSVSFANPSINITDAATTVQIVFSAAATQAGTVTITSELTNVAYGTDYSTTPAAVGNVLEVPFQAGATTATFTVNRLADMTEETKNVKFTITDATFNANITGNASILVNFNETASLGASLAAQVGGPNQPNQVYADLSSGGLVTVPRVSWDLGLYSGSDFRLMLNTSLKMSAKQLATTNIDTPAQADDSMLISQGSGSATQVDAPEGMIEGTVISVSDTDEDNKVYLVNLGNGPGAATPTPGTEGSAGSPHRGWKKIRVLKSGSDYKVQYADIDATTHQELIVTKNPAYNFAFFSFTSNSVVQAEPQKNQWDLNFTTFTNVLGGGTPYYFADFIVTNTKGGARSYMVMTSEVSYENFTMANVDESLFTNDQRNIGANWRSTSAEGPDGIPVSQFVLRTDRFFVIKDPSGNIYKLKLTGGANQAGERGFPTFQYSLLQ